MQNYHIIEVKYSGPTNTRGSHVKLTSARFQQTVSIPYDYSFNSAVDIAVDYLKNEGHAVVGTGETQRGYAVVLESIDNKFKPLKEIK